MEGTAGRYRRLLAEPGARGLAVADVCARLPQGMVSVCLLLVVAWHASMAAAGLAVACYTLGQGVTGPARGRLADRYGLALVCAICAAGYALALAALAGAALNRAPAGLLAGLAAAAGLVVPPLSPGMRSLWSVHAAAGLRQVAFALDAAVFDLAYITGPVLASVLATGVSPAAAVGVMLALTGVAVVIVGRRSGRAPALGARATPRAHRAPGRRSILGPLRSAGLARLLAVGALTNAALSAAEVALTGYVRHHHALWASGPLLAGVSAGSILGSLLLGARPARARRTSQARPPEAEARPPEAEAQARAWRRLPLLLGCYTLGLLLLTAAGLVPPLLAVAAPLAGLCLGPSLATLFGLAAAAAPPGAGTEIQAWLNSIMNGGAAAGAALAGLAAGWPVLALGVAAALAALAALSSLIGRPAAGLLAASARAVNPGRAG
ncbi:MAG TPA: MFS transporter [Streptosporangiaceae bacterium]|jgi:MFS family permease